MFTFDCTQEIYNALSGLAYRIADNTYMIERYGRTDVETELKQNHVTICGLFDDLDALRVPYWVQNTVICWAEDWRRYKSGSLFDAFQKYINHPDFSVSFARVSNF